MTVTDKIKTVFLVLLAAIVLFWGYRGRDAFVSDKLDVQPDVVRETVAKLNQKHHGELWQWQIYTAGFGDVFLMPQLPEADPKAVLWIGGNLNLQPTDLNRFAYVLVTSPLMRQMLQPYYRKNIYVVPAGIRFETLKRTNEYAAVIGNPPYIAEILQEKGIPYKVLSWQEAEKAVEKKMPFTMVFAGNRFDDADSADMPAVLLKAAAEEVPLAGYWSGHDSVDPMYFFNDTASFFMFEKDAGVLVEEMAALKPEIKKRTERAKEFVMANFSVQSAADKIESILFDGKNAQAKAGPKSVEINISTMVGHYGAGDYWIARDIADVLEKNGYRTDLSYINSYFMPPAETTLYLRGRFRLGDLLRKDGRSVYYLMYPQKGISAKEYEEQLQAVFRTADKMISASKKTADKFSDISYFPQFTNTERFYPDYNARLQSEVLFIGNRHFDRKAALAVREKGLPITIYGNFWEEGVAKGGYIDNRELRQYYSSAKIVLNDTEAGMKEQGIISNRIFDATACGALVISDYAPEIEAVYGDSVPMYKTYDELERLIKYYLKYPEKRQEKAKQARDITLKNFALKNVEDQLVKIISDITSR